MSYLIIVESPTKARTLSRFLGKDYRIEATMGHVRDLPQHSLGIEITPENGGFKFAPDYQVIADRKAKIKELKSLALSVDSVVLATDPDREGEAIAYHVGEILKDRKLKTEDFKRIVFHEITKSAIERALKEPRKIDGRMVDAQQARRILDRLVGYKLSPLLWNKLGKRWLSAGRVQSVAVRLIVEREREILSFKPVEYWLIDVEVGKNAGKFIIRLVEINGKKAELGSGKETETIIAELQKSYYTVSSVNTREVRRYPYPPFTTSTLQQAASNRFGWSAKRTMRTAQNLYEEGYISYHRTDSTNIAAEAVKMVRDFIGSVYGSDYLPVSPKIYKTKSKVAQEAHEAIRPTNLSVLGSSDFRKFNPDNLSKHNLKELSPVLGRDSELLYSLIWRRFTASQMSEAVYDQTSVNVEGVPEESSNRYGLRVSGSRVKFAGWQLLYDKLNEGKSDEEKEENAEEEKKDLPLLAASDRLDYFRVIPQQKFTEPPPRFNEASLIKALEEKGIGRPSTYAPIISTIQDRKYVEKRERKFFPTDLGMAVNDFLVAHFPDIFDISFTAKMEEELDEIASGEMEWMKVVGDFYSPFDTTLQKVYKNADRVKLDLGTTDEKCPECGHDLVIRLSKYGKFLACSNFPACKYTRTQVEKAGIPCPKCGGDIVVKKTRRGKQFYGCINYPDCTFAAWKKEDIRPQTPAPVQVPETDSKLTS